GHGSPRSFRSNRGSGFAVRAVEMAWQKFTESQNDFSDLTACKRLAEEKLPKWIVRHWRELVANDLSERPFVLEEWGRLKERERDKTVREVALDPIQAYGTT